MSLSPETTAVTDTPPPVMMTVSPAAYSPLISVGLEVVVLPEPSSHEFKEEPVDVTDRASVPDEAAPDLSATRRGRDAIGTCKLLVPSAGKPLVPYAGKLDVLSDPICNPDPITLPATIGDAVNDAAVGAPKLT